MLKRVHPAKPSINEIRALSNPELCARFLLDRANHSMYKREILERAQAYTLRLNLEPYEIEAHPSYTPPPYKSKEEPIKRRPEVKAENFEDGDYWDYENYLQWLKDAIDDGWTGEGLDDPPERLKAFKITVRYNKESWGSLPDRAKSLFRCARMEIQKWRLAHAEELDRKRK